LSKFNLKKSNHIFFAVLRLSLNKFISQRYAFLCLFFCLFILTSCKNENANQSSPTPTREITDDLGRRVRLPEKVTGAVSLAPNLTEIAFAIGAGERLVGVTSFCDFPEEAKKIRKIGDTLTPNIENIIALKPQVVLVSTASQMENFTKTLDAQGIAYFVTNPNSLDDIYKSIYQIGEIFGTGDKASQIVDGLKKRVADIEARTVSAANIKVFVQIDKNSLYTVGKDSFMTDLINRAGGESVTKDISTAYPKISKETALALNPEAIILSESENNREPNEVFVNSPAVKNGKVYRVNADLLSRPAPRIVEGLEQLARALHPESFE
jgi:iron complex transport system substrate-binding protein